MRFLAVCTFLLGLPLGPLVAEEEHAVLPALSQTTLSGYIDTSAIWTSTCPIEGPVWIEGSWMERIQACAAASSPTPFAELLRTKPVLTLSAEAGRRFKVETRSSFAPGSSWLALCEIEIPLNATTIHVLDTSSEATPMRFYRCVSESTAALRGNRP